MDNRESFKNVVEKPKDWPANEREKILEVLCDKVEEFRNNPSYKTREVLLALTCEHDFNQSVGLGLVRVTEYEVGIYNHLYLMASVHQITSLKTYLYNIISQTTRLQKMVSWSNPLMNIEEDTFHIIPYEKGLLPAMRLYYFVYHKYTVEKSKSFADQLIDIVENIIELSSSEEEINSIAYAYSAMLFDISNMHGNKREKLWEFTRKELFILFELEARLLNKNKQVVNTRPTKGVLMMQISNFILKSRHNYNEDYICKYLPTDVARNSIINHQIWMKKTELLNDEREQKVIPELFKDESWIEYDWVKNIEFTATRTYYVSCFSKSVSNKNMQDGYGDCLYGYKNDRIVDLIGPIGMRKLTKKDDADSELPDEIERPYISQVITFDVLYNVDEAKEELKYLFQIIDMFDLKAEEKKSFLEEILQYWILSVKDNKWHEERERRYVLFLYNDYDYREIEFDDTFLKVKTTLFVTPDFIIGNNPSKFEIARQLKAKRNALFKKEYLFCNDCLMQDHDLAIHKMPDKCPICGSINVKMVYKTR